MKTYIKISLMLLLSIMSFSCTDDTITTNETQNEVHSNIMLLTSSNNSNPNARMSNYSMLFFKDKETFYATIDNLEIAAEQHDDAYIAAFPKLNAEELTLNEESAGYNDYDVYNDFINQYHFENSLLHNYISAENKWLHNETLDPEKDPDIGFLDLDPEQLVLLNNDGAVKIGKDIYVVLNEGAIKFKDTDIDTFAAGIGNLDDFSFDWGNIGPIDISGSLGGVFDFDWDSFGSSFGIDIEVLRDLQTETCISSNRESDHWNLGSNHRLKGVVKVKHAEPWRAKIKAKSKYYKKTWGVWHTTRAGTIIAALDGRIKENCDDSNSIELYRDIHNTHETNKKKAKYKVHPDDFGYSSSADFNVVEGFYGAHSLGSDWATIQLH